MVIKFENIRDKIKSMAGDEKLRPLLISIGSPGISPAMQEAIKLSRFKDEIIIAERKEEENLIAEIGVDEYQKIKTVPDKVGVSTPELHYMLQRLGNVGLKAAEAGRKLGIAMKRIAMENRLRLSNVSYKKMLRKTPKRKRRSFLRSVKHWERMTFYSRYDAVFNRSGDGQNISFGLPPLIWRSAE